MEVPIYIYIASATVGVYIFPKADTSYHAYGPGDGWGGYRFTGTYLGSTSAIYGAGDEGGGIGTA